MWRYPIKKQILAYSAGIFDGEGCVTITKDKDGRHYLRATVTNTCQFLCFWLEKKFAGSYVGKPRKAKETYKPCFVWTVSGKVAQRFLKRIQPFCLVKSEQIKVALSFPTKAYSVHCTSEEKILRERLYWNLRELNTGGVRKKA